MKPLLIVFDGIDGNGKSTQAALLKEWLEARGLKVFTTSEPSKSEYGQRIDELLRKKQASSLPKERWIELFTQDRNENIKEIRAALQENSIVICDRYYYSTLAYQLDEEQWQSYAEQFLKPDMAFIIDVPVDLALERTKEKYRRTGERRAYFERPEILRKVRQKFLLLPRYLKDNIKIINGDRPISVVSKDIKKEVMLILE